MKTIPICLAASLVLGLSAAAAPRLVLSTPSLTPETEIQLVVDAPAVEQSGLGKPTENSWIVINPSLPSKLIWQSPTSAKLVPDALPQIGTTYSFTVKSGLQYLDGAPVPPDQLASVASESFAIKSVANPHRWTHDRSPSNPTWLFMFNDAVDPTAAAAFISFSSGSGQRIAARLEHATTATAGYLAHQSRPWAERGKPLTPKADDAVLSHILIVTPIAPLPVGEWGISVLQGLPNQSATARVNADNTYPIGNVEPFKITSIEGLVAADQPRKIILQFNQAVPAELPADFLQTLLTVDPRPADLAATSQGHQIHLTGNFREFDQYGIRLSQPLVSRQGLALQAPLFKTITFKNLEPALVLPSQDEAQLAHGKRVYPIRTVNLTSIRVRVKQLEGADLLRAKQGYSQYSGSGHDGKSVTPTAPIPYALIAGKTLLDREFVLDNAIDTSKRIELLWDELLPKELRHAALFVDVTGTPRPETTAGQRNSQALLQLTDIGLAWKFTPTEALLYAFSCQSGAPLAGVEISVIGEEATSLHTATTDASGILTLPRHSDARLLQARLGSDVYISAFDTTLSSVGTWHFPVRYSWEAPAESSRQAFLFTDRSLYRPGETVRIKGLVRMLRGNSVEAADADSPRLVILDPTRKEILSSPVILSGNGSFDFTYSLPASITGTHSIRLEYPAQLAAAEATEDWRERSRLSRNAVFQLPLRVEEFRRNTFEVTQSIAPPAIGATSVAANLTAAYYQGQPVASGKIRHFSRIAQQNLYPERFRDFQFGNHRVDDWSYWYHYFGYSDDGGHQGSKISHAQGDAVLTSVGSADFTIDIPQSDFPTTREIQLSSQVTDANHQTLTATSTAVVHPASVYVGVSRNDRLVRVGEELPLRLVAVDPSGEPLGHEVKLTATLTREINSTVKTQTDTGATTTQNHVEEVVVSTSEIALDPVASTREGQPLILTPQEPGLHFLTVRGTDPEGRAFATVTRFHVYGSKEYPWLYEDGLRVKLVAEKKSYRPGETARILVLSPIEGTALVTIEREKVLRSFLIELKSDQPVIEVPLTDDDAPNAYVSVLIVKGAQESARDHKEPQLRLGYCELTVESTRNRLAIEMKATNPDAAIETISTAESPVSATFRPGDSITISGTVSLGDGSPAANAEVTLYAEDEGTLAVTGYATPNPTSYFYAPRNLEVSTGTSFHTFISENPDAQNFYNKGFFIGGGGGEEEFANLLRKNFDPCATWAPALITNADGHFSHTFELPDTLTRYRLIAIAHQNASRFGSAESALIVSKPLMLEPKTPRFANQSDVFDPQVLVQNASPYTGTWEITFNPHAATGTPVCRALVGTSETLTLAPGESATLIFPTSAETTGDASFHWSATPISLVGHTLDPALTRSLSDAVESRFPVHYPMPLLRQVKFVKLNGQDATHHLLDHIDPNLASGNGHLDLEFSRSPLAEAAGSVDFLLTYPYGCVEQTTSSLIPWLAAGDLRSIIPAFAKTSPEKINAAIQGGADRLLSMQLPDGSFSYWPGNADRVDWATPYAGMGLVLAKEKGAMVPASAIESLANHLTVSLRGIAGVTSASSLETHCQSLLVLALCGNPQESYHQLLTDRIGDLTPSARALLASAMAASAKGDASKLAAARAVLTSEVPFQLKNDTWMRSLPNAAYELLAWLAVDPDGGDATRLLERMLNERNPYGHWSTTWANGWSLLAMSRYAATEEDHNPTVALVVESLEGTDTLHLDSANPTATRRFSLTPDMLLTVRSDRAAFVRVRVAAKPQLAPVPAMAANGLSIDRIHERILADGSAEILTDPQIGDLIRVTLQVTLPSDDTRYLVIEDPLPAIFETVNSDFATQRSAQFLNTSENDWNVSHSELRDDRAVFFLDQVHRRGTYTLTYLARCTLAGKATAPSSKVESMYDPEKFAISASRVFTAR